MPPRQEVQGKAQLIARLIGEIAPGEIPPSQRSPGRSTRRCWTATTTPLEAVVEVGPGKGGRGWNDTSTQLGRRHRTSH
jgi:hypothetical protein